MTNFGTQPKQGKEGQVNEAALLLWQAGDCQGYFCPPRSSKENAFIQTTKSFSTRCTVPTFVDRACHNYNS